MAAPEVGEVVDGYQYIGGNPKDQRSWRRSTGSTGPAGPQAAPPEWGAGAVVLPNKVVLGPRGPRGGAPPKLGSIGSLDLKDDEAKAQTYAQLMTTAERQYQDARKAGYNPGSLRNGFANFVEDAPVVGDMFGGAAAWIRDDTSDRGKNAERAWLDAQLKAMTGAGQSKLEATSNPRTYFQRFGEDDDAEANKAQMRRTAFDAVKLRSGPAASTVPRYPGGFTPPAQGAPRPVDLSGRYSRQAVAALPPGALYVDAQGNTRRNDNGGRFLSDPKAGNPVIRPASGSPRGGAAPKRLSPAEAANLAPGTRFVGQDGVERVRK